MKVAGANHDRELERVRALVSGAMEAKAKGRVGSLASAVLDALRSGEDPLVLGRVYETALGEVTESGAATARKKRGAYFTPRWLVDRVLDLTLDPLIREAGDERLLSLGVLDPACGSGEFLVAAIERLAKRLNTVRGGGVRSLRTAFRAVSTRCIHGIDRDEVAVALCRGAIERLAGSGTGSCIVRGDGLLDDVPAVDVVIGNPPYLNRLERSTARSASQAARLRERFGDAAMAYTDLAWLFLLRTVQTVKPGGRVGLVLPQSVLGARDAAGVRSAVGGHASMTDLWLADSHVFGASVHVCVPVFEVGRPARAVQRWIGQDHVRLPDASTPSGTWAPLAAIGVPDISLHSSGVVSDVAEVTADFRDQYYGLVGRVADGGQPSKCLAPLVTTGMVEVGRITWGRRPCRFAGERWDSPLVDLRRLSPEMTAWAAQRRRPKVVLATQTQVLEAAVDEKGEWLPVTPMISAVPRTGVDPWTLGALLNSPVLSAMAARLSAGTGLSRGVIKLSAGQVRALPMPRDECGESGRLLHQSVAESGEAHLALLDQCARLTCRAYGLSVSETEELVRWWWDRQRMGSRPVGTDFTSNPRQSG